MVVVGSSTVYPFSQAVAEQFTRETPFKAPKIASTGTGGGMKLFCKGLGADTPDMVNASRPMKISEFEMCQKNGVTDIIEIPIGYDGIVMANTSHSDQFRLTRKDVFLALAHKVPTSVDGELILNPYRKWQEIRPELPNADIEVLGPPPSSGTRDAFERLFMESGCDEFDWIKALKQQDNKSYKSLCHAVREDGPYINVGENDNLVIKKLQRKAEAIGIFGFSFLNQNNNRVKAVVIENVLPDFKSIANGSYPMSRPLFIYIKKNHMHKIMGMSEYLHLYTNKKTIGKGGFLSKIGLIPLSARDLDVIQKKLKTLTTLNL